MSSILKALKKLEQEKAARSEPSVEIARDILRSTPMAAKSNWVPMTLVVGVVLLVGLGNAFWALSPSKTLPVIVSEPVASVMPPAPPQPISAPVAEPAPPVPVASAAAPSEPTEVRIETVEVKPLPKVKAPKLVAKTAPRAQTRNVPSHALQPEVVFPKLALSGIVYQDEAEARLAVVNELPVMAGTMIAGAVVEEIQRDRVRFSYKGKSIEVQLK